MENQTGDEKPSWFRYLPDVLRKRIARSPLLKKIVGNTSWLVSERVLNLGIRFFVGVWVVRFLGPESYGVYSYALSFVGIFMAVAALGLDQIVVRNISRESTEDAEILGTALLLRIAGASITMAIIAAILVPLESDWQTRLYILIVSGQLVFKSTDVFAFWFRAQINSRFVVWVKSAVSLLYAGGQVGLIYIGADVFYFVVLVTVQSLMTAVGLLVVYRVYGPPFGFRLRFGKGQAVRLLRDSWPLIASALMVSAYMKIDQVMVKNIAGSAELGQYSAAVKISEAWHFIPIAIVNSTFPAIVEAREVSRTQYYRRIQHLYTVVVWLAIAVAVGIFAASDIIETVLFGAEYFKVGGVLQIHVWSGIAVFFGTAWSRWIVAENRQMLVTLSHAFALIANVGLNLWLIEDYGAFGAAWATTLSYIAGQIVGMMLYKRRVVFRMFLSCFDVRRIITDP